MSTRRTRLHLALPIALILLLALGLPQTALAGAPQGGVHLDPNSPESVQYAIPLVTARGSAGGPGGGGLFGSGITRHAGAGAANGAGAVGTTDGSGQPAPGSTDGSAAGSTVTRRGNGRRRPAAPARRLSPGQGAATLPAAAGVLHPGGDAGILWMGLTAALVLAVGVAGSVAISGGRRGGG
jgi:hypothetical protein